MAEAAVGAAGLGLAVPGVIDLCIKYGHHLMTLYRDYRHAAEIDRINKFLVSLVRGEVSEMLEMFKAMYRDPIQGEQVATLVQQLYTLLAKVVQEFSPSLGVWAKVRFTFHTKKVIDRACAEIEDWHNRLFRHFMIRVLLGPPDLPASYSTAATQSVMLERVQRIKNAIMKPDVSKMLLVPFDSAVTLRALLGSDVWETGVGGELVEYRAYSGPQALITTQLLVRDLAARLHEVEPSTMGLLRCRGFTPEPTQDRIALRFQYPAGKRAAGTLQSLLVHHENLAGVKHALSDRVLLARKLASAVLYMHICDFVHKNIRPDNVLIFTNNVPPGDDPAGYDYPRVIGEPFLVGFDSVRKAVAASNMIKVEDWRKNIYLHPERHRMGVGDEYTVRHDVYSLGVVLLEIAMWGSFTDRRKGMMGRYVWKDQSTPLLPGELKERYLSLARSQVPRIIGTRYADIVVSCLEGLQDEEKGGILNDQDGLVTGTAYVAQVLSKLEEISL
jgi:hypothetical protein